MRKNKEKRKLIKAEQKYVRLSPRKLKIIAEAVKRLTPLNSLEHLSFLNKRGAKPLAKTIKQAISNAVKNGKLNEEELEFEKIEILKGPSYKRWRPVSRGRAHTILKRTSHIRVTLKSKIQNAKIKKKIKEKNSRLLRRLADSGGQAKRKKEV